MKQTQTKHVFHLKRFSLFLVLVFAFFIVRIDAASIHARSNASVLAYATSMDRGALLSGTNAARSANGLGPLTINSRLNSAAQAKAQHMADNNYWAHVAPDGTQPWYFFNQAGYNYLRAGENLAYGFSTSQGAVDGWMNSPSHRANILGEYVDVGFGIVNVPDYQSNGEQTIVVAHYGTPVTVSPAPVPAPTAKTTAPTAPAAPTSTPAPVAATPPTSPPAPSSSAEQPTELQRQSDTVTPVTREEPTTSNDTAETQPPVATGDMTPVSVLSMLSMRQLPLAAFISLLFVGFAAVGYILTHRIAFRQAVHAGEHFAVTHPGLDAAVLAAVAALIVLTTYGNIG